MSTLTGGTVPDTEVSGPLRRFARTQAEPVPAAWKTWFDAAFGVVLPTACLVLDPIVFRTWEGGEGMVTNVRLMAYGAIVPQIAALAYWLMRRRGPYLLAAYLHVGSLTALLVGLLLLPLTIFGTFLYGIGIAGLTPFGTALAFHRRARHAAAAAPVFAVRRARVWDFGVAVVLALALPATLQLGVDRVMDAAIRMAVARPGDEAELAARAVDVLRWVDGDSRLFAAHARERDPVRSAAISRLYQRGTHQPIQDATEDD